MGPDTTPVDGKVSPNEQSIPNLVLHFQIYGGVKSLAYRKQKGDPTAQAETEAVRKMMRTQ